MPNPHARTHHDLEIRIDANLGKKLLDALEFPLRLDFSGEGESDLPLEPMDQAMEENLDALLDDVVAQPLVAHLEQGAPGDNAKPNSANGGDKRFQVRLSSCSVMITRAPELQFGNPAELRKVALRVRADLKVGARVWGNKWIWRDATIPWLDLEGRRAILKLTARGSQLLVVPELENSHLVLGLTVWKWPLRFRLGISQLINRRLEQLGPFKIVDLVDFNSGRQFLGKTPQFTIESVAESMTGLLLKVNIEWR
jgi:hypothetical protein